MPHLGLEGFERIFGLGARGHFLYEHRGRAQAHGHGDASVVGHFIELKQGDFAVFCHGLLGDEDTHIRISATARRHDRRTHRDVFDLLRSQFSHDFLD